MNIEHIGIWTDKLEEMREFYEKFFEGKSNKKYINEKKGFESYFITFDDGARIELMSSINMSGNMQHKQCISSGYCHLAFYFSTKEKVDELTAKLTKEGFELIDGPRITGDGYYESNLFDPDKNKIELVTEN